LFVPDCNFHSALGHQDSLMKTGWAVCIHFVSSQIVCVHVSHRRTELLLLSIACPSRVYGMLNKVPKDFMFFVKTHRDLIHVRKNAEAEARRGPLPVSGELECDCREEDYLRWFTESWGILIP